MHGRRRAHDADAVQAEAPRLDLRPHAQLEEGDRRAGARRADRAVRGRRDRAGVGPTDDGRSRNTSRHPRARRFSTWLTRDELTRYEPEKSLVKGKSRTGGRNTHGRITSRHRGGGAKRRYRADRLQAPQGRRAGQGRGDRVRPQPQRAHRAAALPRRREALHPGAAATRRSAWRWCPARRPTSRSATAFRSQRIPTGTVIHNVELTPGRGGQLGRSAGAAIQLVAKEGATRPCGCPRARCGWSPPSAARRSARSATPTTRTSRSGRPAATVTRASGRRRAGPR